MLRCTLADERAHNLLTSQVVQFITILIEKVGISIDSQLGKILKNVLEEKIQKSLENVNDIKAFSNYLASLNLLQDLLKSWYEFFAKLDSLTKVKAHSLVNYKKNLNLIKELFASYCENYVDDVAVAAYKLESDTDADEIRKKLVGLSELLSKRLEKFDVSAIQDKLSVLEHNIKMDLFRSEHTPNYNKHIFNILELIKAIAYGKETNLDAVRKINENLQSLQEADINDAEKAIVSELQTIATHLLKVAYYITMMNSITELYGQYEKDMQTHLVLLENSYKIIMDSEDLTQLCCACMKTTSVPSFSEDESEAFEIFLNRIYQILKDKLLNNKSLKQANLTIDEFKKQLIGLLNHAITLNEMERLHVLFRLPIYLEIKKFQARGRMKLEDCTVLSACWSMLSEYDWKKDLTLEQVMNFLLSYHHDIFQYRFFEYGKKTQALISTSKELPDYIISMMSNKAMHDLMKFSYLVLPCFIKINDIVVSKIKNICESDGFQTLCQELVKLFGDKEKDDSVIKSKVNISLKECDNKQLIRFLVSLSNIKGFLENSRIVVEILNHKTDCISKLRHYQEHYGFLKSESINMAISDENHDQLEKLLKELYKGFYDELCALIKSIFKISTYDADDNLCKNETFKKLTRICHSLLRHYNDEIQSIKKLQEIYESLNTKYEGKKDLHGFVLGLPEFLSRQSGGVEILMNFILQQYSQRCNLLGDAIGATDLMEMDYEPRRVSASSLYRSNPVPEDKHRRRTKSDKRDERNISVGRILAPQKDSSTI